MWKVSKEWNNNEWQCEVKEDVVVMLLYKYHEVLTGTSHYQRRNRCSRIAQEMKGLQRRHVLMIELG